MQHKDSENINYIIKRMFSQQSHRKITCLEQPQPAGPLRNVRIDLLLALDSSNITLFTLPTIELLLNEIRQYNDVRLEKKYIQLKRQKKIKEIINLKYWRMKKFTESEIQQLYETILQLNDKRLENNLRRLKVMRHFNQLKKSSDTGLWSNFKDMFSFAKVWKSPKVEKEQKQKDEESQYLSCEQQKKSEWYRFNFKHD